MGLVEGENDQLAAVADVLGAGVEHLVVVDEDAPVEQEVFEAMGVAGSEEEEEPAGLGPEVFTEEFLLGGGVAALRCDGDKESGIGGNLAADREVEAIDFEVSDAELVARDGEAAVAVGFIGAEFAVAGEEVDFLAGGTGHIKEGGGDGLFAEEGGALLILVPIEFGEGYGAAVFAADEEHHVRLFEAEGFGFAAVLINVEVFDGDLPGGIGVAGVGVFAEQATDLSVLMVVADGGDDLHRPVELPEVGEGLGREGETAMLGEVAAPVEVAGEVVQTAEEREEEHGLQHEIDGADPAGGTEAVGGGQGGAELVEG